MRRGSLVATAAAAAAASSSDSAAQGETLLTLPTKGLMARRNAGKRRASLSVATNVETSNLPGETKTVMLRLPSKLKLRVGGGGARKESDLGLRARRASLQPSLVPSLSLNPRGTTPAVASSTGSSQHELRAQLSEWGAQGEDGSEEEEEEEEDPVAEENTRLRQHAKGLNLKIAPTSSARIGTNTPR